MSRTAGQATVELLAALPLLLVAVLAAGQLLVAGVGRELAAHAAAAAAAAVLQDGDPVRAARRALPGWSHSRVRVVVRERVVRVTLRPPGLLPGLARRLTAEAQADAGPPA